METESTWTYATPQDGDTAAFKLKITYKMTPEAERERDTEVMNYLRARHEQFKGAFVIDPVALCDLWASGWLAGHGDGHRAARLEAKKDEPNPNPGTPEPQKLSRKKK